MLSEFWRSKVIYIDTLDRMSVRSSFEVRKTNHAIELKLRKILQVQKRAEIDILHGYAKTHFAITA